MSYLQKYVFQKKQKTANKNQTKAITEHISCDCKCKFNSTTCNSNQKWNNETSQFKCKNYHKCKKDYSWNASTCICENIKYVKSIADTLVTVCDEIIIVMDIVSTKKRNPVATNGMSTALINYHSKKVRDCYILHTVLLVIILLLIMTIICNHYAEQKIQYKIEKNAFKFVLKIISVIILMT